MTASVGRMTPDAQIVERGEREFAFTDHDYRRIAALMHADAGIDLGGAKAELVYSRLAKRLRLLRLNSFREYCDLVESDDGRAERLEMLSALTTNVTRFYRERPHFDHLERQVLPSLLGQARNGGKVRIWSAGCSTGQEPYSIALSLLALEPQAHRLDVKVLATDIDPRVVACGREGVYPDGALTDVPAALRARYFQADQAIAASYRIAEEARTLVSFRTLNLHGDWPMRGLFQVIFCRNVVIYFDEEGQRAIWSRFVSKLAPEGWLYIGHSERIGGPASAHLRSAGVTTYQLTRPT
ncbi:MAG TPA: protein-glutamate O-methyltransferase [Roseiarcus sp.]|nr:protein-glutamate O-methyltransferase [Roseiarcus sp.]